MPSDPPRSGSRRGLTRKQALAVGLVGMVGAGALADRLLGPGAGSPGSIAPTRPRHGAVTADFASMGDRVGWGRHWFLPSFERQWEVRSGRALLHLPAGLRGTAPAQPFPVFFQDHDCVWPNQELVFRLSNQTLRPGLAFAAVSLWEFMAVTVERGKLVLARYGRTDREVLMRRPVGRTRAGVDYRLRVKVQDRRVMARLWSDGSTEPSSWQIDASHRARHGSVGVVAVAPVDGQPARLALTRYRVSSPAYATTPARLPTLITGPPYARRDRRWDVILRACADRPCTIRFEWSGDPEFGSLLGSTDDQLASTPPWSASHTIQVSNGSPIYWRALAGRDGVETASHTHRVEAPSTSRQLVLGAASCAQLWGAKPYVGLTRFQAAAAQRPALLVYQGDIGYPGNSHDSCYLSAADTFADRFKRTLSDPHFEALRALVPTAFTMDDHDYGPPNNADRTTIAPWAAPLWNRFHAEPTPRGYTDGRIGDVHWFTLDGRRYADPVTDPNTPRKTKLGLEQRSWLRAGMRASDAEVFVIFSADIFASRIAIDCWLLGWPDEYKTLMTLFMGQQLAGKRVIILSGDAHGMRIHYHPDPAHRSRSASMPVVEFVCSGLRARTWSMNLPGDRTVDPLRRVEGKSGLGMISIDPPSVSNREITLRAIAGDAGPIDLFPPLTVPFAPA